MFLFKGVEFVCCPHHHKQHKKKHVKKKKLPVVDRVALEIAVKEFEKFLPEFTQGMCLVKAVLLTRYVIDEKSSVKRPFLSSGILQCAQGQKK